MKADYSLEIVDSRIVHYRELVDSSGDYTDENVNYRLLRFWIKYKKKHYG